MTYSWQTDFSGSYWLACRMLALRHGHARPANGFEWYWLEAQGLVP